LFDSYISRYGKRLFGLCLKLCQSREDAEDLYQETWIKAYKFIDKYDRSKDFEPWLTRICANTYRDTLRRQKWRKLTAVFQTNEEKDAVMSSVPSSVPSNDEDYSDVRDAVNKLPEKYRLPIVLYYWLGHDVKTLAEIMEIAEGTAKYRLHIAREMLKGRLEPNG